MRAKRRVVGVLLGIAFPCWLYWHAAAKDREELLLNLSTVDMMEEELGPPSYVFDGPGGWFGRGMATKEEFAEGIELRVYLVQRLPPRFIVVKTFKGSREILSSRVERS